MQNVKNGLNCRKFDVNKPVTSNVVGHIWVKGYELKDVFNLHKLSSASSGA